MSIDQTTASTSLSDDDLLILLGFKPADFTSPEQKAHVVASMAAKRATYERMAHLTVEGLAPKPAGVLIDWDRARKRA